MVEDMEKGLLLLEHINVNVADWNSTQKFYEVLGCQHAGPAKPFHMNCGAHTQFHLLLEEPVQVWRGVVTVGYTENGMQLLRERIESYNNDVVNFEANQDDIKVSGIWGRFLLRIANESETILMTHPTSRPNTEVSINIGVVGIVSMSLPVPISTSKPIAKFYSEVFGFDTELQTNPGRAIILGGPQPKAQRIVFEETEDVLEYNGSHFCIYIRDFDKVFERCLEQEIVYINPRFPDSEDATTLEQARNFQAFRILHVRNSGNILLTEEHEIRSSIHPFITLK